jgi:hypothetical protein
MKKITLSFEVLAAIIALTILQPCADTSAAPPRCKKPTLSTPTPAGPHAVWVTMETATTGAHLCLTLDNAPFCIEINRRRYTALVTIPPQGTRLSVKATKSGWRDSWPAVGTYP